MCELYTNETQKSDYTKVPNKEIANNRELTWQAKGLWLYMAGKPEGWKFSIDRMARQCKSGYTATKSALDELLEYGLVTRVVKNTKNGKEARYGIYKTPTVKSPTGKSPVGESPVGEIGGISNTEFSKTESSKTEKRHIGDSDESCVCNEGSSRKENLKESEDLVEDKSLEETSLNGNLAGAAEAEVVTKEAKGVKVPPADNVGSSPSEEHSLEANESSSKVGLDAEKVNGKDESKKSPKKGNKRAVFNPPSIEEIQDYCNSRNNGLDAEAFWAYYESNGWMVGKNKMKSWKAAVITWEKKSREWGNGNQGNRNTGLVRGDAMYEPKSGEDMTYERMFKFWKKAIGASVPQTVSQVEACKGLLADVGEKGVERLIVALRMRSEHQFLTKELLAVSDFVGLGKNVPLVKNFYDKHWKEWQRWAENERMGKERYAL